jgi:U3 small nucleolar RNA-associated protein 5
MAGVTAFHPSFHRLAVLGGDNRIKLWDTQTATLTTTLQLPNNIPTAVFTCMTWVSLADSGGSKRSQPGEDHNASKSKVELLVVGTERGLIVVWDVLAGKVAKVLGSTGASHTASVNDICCNSAATTLFSCSEDRNILVWDLKSGEMLTGVKGGQHAVKKLALSRDGSILAAGSSGIKLWDTGQMKVRGKLTGHPSTVTFLKFSYDGKKLVSCSSQDRYVYLWNCESIEKADSEDEVKPVGFVCDSPPLLIDINTRPYGKKSKAYDILTVVQGEINIWAHRDANAPQLQTVPDSHISTPQPQSILNTQFCQHNQIIIARGHTGKPSFDKVVYLNGSQLVTDITIQVQEEQSLVGANEVTKTKLNKKVGGTEDSVSILGPIDMGNGFLDAKMPGSGQLPRSSSMLSLEQLVDSIPSGKKSANSTPGLPTVSTTAAPHSGSSLAGLLSQGLRMGDNSIIETVLSCRDPTVINTTILSLPTSTLIPFLEHLVNNFKTSPTAPLSLVPWMRALLQHKASYLMSVGDLVGRVSGLYQTIEARLGVFKKLLRLSGRLHLVLSHVNKATIEEISNAPITVYQEEEDAIKVGAGETTADSDAEDDADGEPDGDADENDDQDGEPPAHDNNLDSDEDAMSQ